MWFFKKKKQTDQDILIKRIKEEQIDLQGIFSDINKRGEVESLYKELCKLSHPDKFEKDPEKKEIAKEIFAQIQKNRNNYTRLKELKQSVEDKLLNS